MATVLLHHTFQITIVVVFWLLTYITDMTHLNVQCLSSKYDPKVKYSYSNGLQSWQQLPNNHAIIKLGHLNWVYLEDTPVSFLQFFYSKSIQKYCSKANSVKLSSSVYLVCQEQGVFCHWIFVKWHIVVSNLKLQTKQVDKRHCTFNVHTLLFYIPFTTNL